VSPSGQHLLHLMLCPNPRERITVAEVMRHPWFQMDLPPPLLTINAHLTQVGRLGVSPPPCTPHHQ
jgi:serine/threonine protein kinase